MSSVFLRAPLEKMENPALRKAARAWGQAITEISDLKIGKIALIRSVFARYGSPGLMVADRDKPEDFGAWFVSMPIGELPEGLAQGFIGRRFREITDQQFVQSSISAFRDAFSEGGPVFHHFCGLVAGVPVAFERLMFPMYDEGRPDALVSVSTPAKTRVAKTRRRLGPAADQRFDGLTAELPVAAAG